MRPSSRNGAFTRVYLSSSGNTTHHHKCDKCGLKKSHNTLHHHHHLQMGRSDEGVHDLSPEFFKAPILSSQQDPAKPSFDSDEDNLLMDEDLIDFTSRRTPRLAEDRAHSEAPQHSDYHRQLIQLCDGRIDDIGVNVLPANLDEEEQPRLLVHGVVLQRTRIGRIRKRKFRHEFLLPGNIDIYRVTWCLEAQTDVPNNCANNHHSDDSDSPGKHEDSQQNSAFLDHNQLVVHAPFYRSTAAMTQPDSIGAYSRSPSRFGHKSNLVLNLHEYEQGQVMPGSTTEPDHETAHKLRSIPVHSTGGGKVTADNAETFTVPLKMSEQPAEYNLTERGCELTETLDPDVDPASIRVHVKRSRGQIWLTFAREIIHEKIEPGSHPGTTQLYKVRTTSRREFKLNPEKFDIRGTAARVTGGKIIIEVPFLLEQN